MAARAISAAIFGGFAGVLPVDRFPTPAAGVAILAFFELRIASCSANRFADATSSAAWSFAGSS